MRVRRPAPAPAAGGSGAGVGARQPRASWKARVDRQPGPASLGGQRETCLSWKESVQPRSRPTMRRSEPLLRMALPILLLLGLAEACAAREGDASSPFLLTVDRPAAGSG